MLHTFKLFPEIPAAEPTGPCAKKTGIAVPVDARRTYEKFRAAYLAEYRPSGATESTLLDMVILAAWQLYRIRELVLFAPIELASPLSPGSPGKSDRLARYRAGYERMLKTNLNQLNQIQQERLLLAVERESAVPAHIPPGVRTKQMFRRLANIEGRSSARTAAPCIRNSEEQKPGTVPASSVTRL